MKTFPLSKIKTATLMIVGVLASAISFIYYFVLKNPYDVILWTVCIIDFILFTLSTYRIDDNSNRSKVKKSVFTILRMIGFFVFWQAVFAAATHSYSLELFFGAFLIGLFLSPSFILLLPVMEFIADVLT